MSDLTQRLNAGDLLIIETGEYSDSRYHGPVRMLVSAMKQELAEAYRREWVQTDEWKEEPDGDGFLPWLIRTKRAEHVDNVHAWHVGGYSEFEP